MACSSLPRLSWKIPRELESCLEFVQVVRDAKRQTHKTVSAPIYPKSASSIQLEREMTPGDERPTFILATFNIGKEGQVKIESPGVKKNPISCSSENMRPKAINFEVNQVGQ